MKKLILTLAIIGFLANSTYLAAEPAFNMGVVTSSKAQSQDEYFGAQTLVKTYGDADSGGQIRHLVYPDDFVTERAKTLELIISLGDDPKTKVIVVNQGPPGTTEAFKALGEKRPDIILLVAEVHEDPDVITQAAHLVVSADNITRGYTIPLAAKKMGAKNLVHISFPRHLIQETVSRRHNIMQVACRDLGMNFYSETAPDPLSEVGQEKAQEAIRESVPKWLKKYGPDTAFFCTNDAHTAPLIKSIIEHGGYFVEADLPSPLIGYPEALGLTFTQQDASDWQYVMAKIEEAVIKSGASGRLGTWAYSLPYTSSTGLGEFGKRLATGQARIDSHEDLISSYERFTPGVKWKATYSNDPKTGVVNKKFALVFQDTYVFGKGFLDTISAKMPAQYYSIQ